MKLLKRFKVDMLSVLACCSLLFTTICSAKICCWFMYQEELPEEAKKLLEKDKRKRI